ncbi:ABC transporter permease [Nocardioides limicola]|uniref:ABC transporter permease n=1 Tax=Nocardioides limicola TaxID=2803368 RepID=UPI0027DC0EE2|nr:iron ABC transporter permease [Nocardioides sp. DJM-14]
MSSLRRLLTLAALAVGPLVVLAIFFALPIWGMVTRGLFVDGAVDLGGIVEVMSRPRTRRVLWFTLWSAGAATGVALALGLPAAYVLHRLAFPGRGVVRALMIVPFVLPTVVVGIAFRQLFAGPLAGLGLDGSPVAIVCGLAFFNVAVVIRVVGATWESLDVRPAQAAAALGASPRQVFATVTWPALRPAVVSAASVVFLFCASGFGVVLMLGGLRYSTVETEIYLLTTQLLDLRAAAVLSLLQLAVVTTLLAIAARLRAVADPTQRRQVAQPRRVGWRQAPILVGVATLMLLVIAPMATLVTGSLQVSGGWGLDNYRALTTPGASQALVVPVSHALTTSLRIAGQATVIALTLALPIAIVAGRRARTSTERRLQGVLDGLFMLPLGVSAVTLGFGFLITLNAPPLDLRSSPWLVPLAQALIALPLVVRTLVPVLQGIDDRQRQAAASLGAGLVRRVVTVDLPVIWKPLLAASGFAFAVSLGEFGATSFLARAGDPTMPVVIYRLIGHPGPMNYGMALAASVVLAATTAVVMLAVERLRVRSVGAL